MLFNRNAFDWQWFGCSLKSPDKNVIIPKCQMELGDLDDIYLDSWAPSLTNNRKNIYFIRFAYVNVYKNPRILMNSRLWTYFRSYFLFFTISGEFLGRISRGFQLKIYRNHTKTFPNWPNDIANKLILVETSIIYVQFALRNSKICQCFRKYLRYLSQISAIYRR